MLKSTLSASNASSNYFQPPSSPCHTVSIVRERPGLRYDIRFCALGMSWLSPISCASLIVCILGLALLLKTSAQSWRFTHFILYMSLPLNAFTFQGPLCIRGRSSGSDMARHRAPATGEQTRLVCNVGQQGALCNQGLQYDIYALCIMCAIVLKAHSVEPMFEDIETALLVFASFGFLVLSRSFQPGVELISFFDNVFHLFLS